MTTQIKVLRENMIRTLTSVKENNVSIADVAISRKRLLEALKLLNYPGTEVLTLRYGRMSYINYDKDGSVKAEVKDEPCIQFNCDHQTLRFLNRPAPTKGKYEPEVKALRFIDHELDVKPVLTGIALDVKTLLSALQFVIPCIATETGRPVLNCVLFDTDNDDNTLTLVSADGFRLGIAQLAVKGLPKDKVLVQLEDASKLVTFLKAIKPQGKGKFKYFGEVYLSYQEDKTVKFSHDQNSLTLTPLDGIFPKYESLVPTTGTHIEFVASEMLQAVKALMPTVKDTSGIIRLIFTREYPAGKITLSAHSEDTGDTSVECTAKVDKDCRIAVNGTYLKEFLSLCGDNVIDLFLTTESIPMSFYADGLDKFEILMPMQVRWD